ncbi:MAG: cytosolic protein [Acidobacteria bacterium]|nr:cytosolic protein [Acidobacteriota bacterium]
MECRQTRNRQVCNCTWEPCSRRGNCCDCLQYHLESRELPACCFPAEAERKYDRSFEHFARLVAMGSV